MKTLHVALLVALPWAASVGTFTKEAAAAGSCSTPNGTCSGLIISIATHPDAGPSIAAEVKIESSSPSPTPGCTLAGGGFWEIAPGRENIVKMLTAAYLSGKPVTLKQVSASGTCFVQWASM